MNAWDTFVERWWAWVVPATWQLAFFILLVIGITWVLQHRSARLRHSLWLLVLIKVFLPPELTLPISIGHWGIGPVWQKIGRDFGLSKFSTRPSIEIPNDTGAVSLAEFMSGSPQRPFPFWPQLACVVWVVGCLLYAGWIFINHIVIAHWLKTATLIDEGPLRIEVERIALKLGLHRIPDLMTTESMSSPCLVGVLHPAIVIPRSLAETLSDRDVSVVLTHELIHWRHGDPLIGWFEIVAQGLFWFHPLMWWADAELRHERECTCDESALRIGNFDPHEYGESLVQVLMKTKSQALPASCLTGVFERGSKLHNRLEEIMNYHPQRHSFGWFSGIAFVATAILLLPMSPGSIIHPPAEVSAEESGKTSESNPQKTEYPTIVKIVPAIGATDVSSDLKEIKVTFDRKMQTGMSWTGGPPDFPPMDDSRKAQWVDEQTCVLPVKLEKESYYRLGLNSKSYRNFKSADGIPLPPVSLYFVTVGASKDLTDKVRVPKAVKFEPANGADSVVPATTQISITFDIPMGAGMSWVGNGPEFPTLAKGQKATWSTDKLTCTLPVTLEPDHKYTIGVNSLDHNNFQSENGVQVTPVVYTFKTGK